MLVYYFVPFVSNHYLLFWVSNGHNSVTVQNQTHVYMNFSDHKDLGNHLLQLCPKVVKHPVYIYIVLHYKLKYQFQALIPCTSTLKLTEVDISICNGIFTHYVTCVISGIRRGVKEVFALLECYASLIGSYRPLGTAYRFHLQGSTAWTEGVPKRRLLTTNQRNITSQKSKDITQT